METAGISARVLRARVLGLTVLPSGNPPCICAHFA